MVDTKSQLALIVQDCQARTIKATDLPLDVAEDDLVEIAATTVIRIQEVYRAGS